MLMNSGCYRAFRRLPALPLAVLLTVLLPACKSIDVPKLPGVTPYRMVIQQGNFISQEMVAQLKPGMTKEQVRFVLGTPLVTDIFHADRWDYVYYREPASGKKEQRNLSVVFEKDRLARVIGDLMPADGTPQAGGFDPQVKPAKPVPEAAKPAAEAPKPAAEALKPAAEAPKSAADAPKPLADSWEPTKSNWSSAPAEPEKKPEATPVAADEPKKPEPEKPAEEKGFFSRMLEKIGL
jgi:outer membrane protein assembly factor BamE